MLTHTAECHQRAIATGKEPGVMERELIQRCCEHDRKAQQELYILTSQRVYGLILRMTGNVDDAMELTQDVYFTAFARHTRIRRAIRDHYLALPHRRQ